MSSEKQCSIVECPPSKRCKPCMISKPCRCDAPRQKPCWEWRLALGLKHNLARYDSLYIALALRSKQVFVTLDMKQATAAAAEGVSVKPITDFT